MKLKHSFALSLILLLFSVTVLAQDANRNSYVFPDFFNGKVLQKGGGITEASLNYNIITQEMVFLNGNQKLVLDQTLPVDTIYIKDRKFVPVKQQYYEKLTPGTIPLYVQYGGKAVLATKDNTNQITDIVFKKNGVEGGDIYNLQVPAGYVLKTDNKYWLQKGKDLLLISSLKKVSDAFPAKQLQITDYLKQNSVSLENQESLIKLINFCNN